MTPGLVVCILWVEEGKGGTVLFYFWQLCA
jgi:hypothetical protein